MKSIQKPKTRPYWHVDVKWIFGLLFTVVFAAWLLVTVAHKITAPQIAIDLTTKVLTSILTRGYTADPESVEKLRADIAASPTKTIQPIPGFPAIVITEQDLQLAPREAGEKIFRQIAEPLYEKGPKKFAAEQTSDPAQQAKFEKDASLLGLVTRERHEQLGQIVLWGSVPVLLLAAGLVWFSHRFGRLVSLGAVLFLVSLPGWLIFSGIKMWTQQPPAPVLNREDFGQALAASRGAFEPLAAAGQQVYMWALWAAIALFVAALIGKIVYSLLAKRKKPVQ